MATKTVVALLFVFAVALPSPAPCVAGITGAYVRPTEPSQDVPLDSDVFQPPLGYNAPEQVHITQGDHEGRAVIVSWVTPHEQGSRHVHYGEASDVIDGDGDGMRLPHKARARGMRYRFHNYTSGYIHHCTLHDLKHDTKYIYHIGSGTSRRQFHFTTPPAVGPDIPYTFGIIGDLGQTFDSNRTLEHYHTHTKGQAVLFLGDLSYADHYPGHDNRRWDSWGRFAERSAAYQPWIWTAGNHELDFVPELGEKVPFKPFTRRYPVPFRASGSTAPLWYSVKRASAYIIVLSSYSAYGKYTPQYQWLEEEFSKVNRSETPWLFVLVHCPLYNSNNYHYMEGETMRVLFEPWFVQNKVDAVFSGHVHSYERSERISNVDYNITNRVCNPIPDPSAPVYITVGDGGNIEGLASSFIDPQPSYSAYREASFGHASLEIKNRTHAFYSWHRNQDGDRVLADSTWLLNRVWS